MCNSISNCHAIKTVIFYEHTQSHHQFHSVLHTIAVNMIVQLQCPGHK